MIDEFVRSQLSPKEKIEYIYEVGDTTWVATNRRVLKYTKSWTNKDLRDLAYKHIVSINLKEEKYYWLSVFAVFFLFLAYFFIKIFDMPESFIYIFGFFAFIIFIVGILSSNSYYEFNAMSIKPKDWKIKDTKSGRGKKFVQIIRSHCFFEKTTEKIKYCPKCGTENPENSNYCISCGTPLK